MGKAIRVFAWCDAHGEKAGVEADHTDVPLRWGKVTVTVDLCGQHYRDTNSVLAPLIAAGKRDGRVNQGVKRGRKPNAYYAGLRQFAKDEGHELVSDAEGKFTYPDDVRRRYDQMLLGAQQADAGPPGNKSV